MNELPVWVGGKEKIVGGLNRHTRCEDVIGILLQDRYKLSKCELSPQNLECYALFERWRGCERQLSPRTRMYKLWKAWGAERDNVKFTLRKSVAISKRRNSLDSEVDGDNGGIKLRGKTKQVTTQGQYNLKEGIVAFDLKKKTGSGEGGGSRGSRGSKNKEKRRRSWADESDVGFSDVRILCPPPLDCDSSASTSSSSGKVTAEGPTTLAEEVEGKAKLPSDEQDSEVLIQRILKQSHQLHNLLETISAVDSDIENYETRLHSMRMQADGRNYVQEAYLLGSNDEELADDSKSTGHPTSTLRHINLEDHTPDFNIRVPPSPHESVIRDLEEYTALCDRIFKADEQLRQTNDDMSELTEEIAQQRTQHEHDSDELKSTSKPRRYEKKRGSCSTKLTHNRAAKDIGFARAQLERSSDTTVALRKEIETLQDELQETDELYQERYDQLNTLTNELTQLERDGHNVSAEDDHDDEIRECVEQNQSTPVNVKTKDSSAESSLDQGIGHDFSPIDMSNRKSPSRSCDTDSSSDTGLSSLHSQDDSEQMVYNISETLV